MKIPPHAENVFTGKIFSVYQWQQPMFDGSTATFEALRRPNTIEVIVTLGDKILLANEEQPGKPQRLTFFGGRQEEGEDPLVCAKRELLEESGFASADWQLYQNYDSASKIDWTTYLYIARNCQKTTEPHLDGGEKIEVRSVSFDEFVRLVTEEDLWVDKDFIIEMCRMRLQPERLTEFKKLLFP